jgi:hypothetical protein
MNERLPLQSFSGSLVPGRNRCGLREFKLTAKYAPAPNVRIYFIPSGDISLDSALWTNDVAMSRQCPWQ